MTKNTLGKFAFAALCAITLSACGGGNTDDPATQPSVADPTPTDGSQNKTALAGYGYNCRILSGVGATANGNAMDQYISLNANGTFDFSTHIYHGGSCSFGHVSGGTAVSQVNMSGTYVVGGTNTTPSTSTKLTFTVTSSTWTVYNPGSDSLALAFANWANACTGGTYGAYSTSTSTSRNFNPTVCSASGGVDLGVTGVPPTVGSTVINIGYRASSSSFQTGATNNSPWSPGAGSFPTTYSLTWQ